jgi:hypothetical protein
MNYSDLKACFDPEPLHEKVKRLEADKARAERELADLKAKAAAEAAKKKTRGEEIAEYVISDCHQYYGAQAMMLSGVNCGYVLSPMDKPNLNAGTEKIISEARRGLAERIDRALADERERCAKELEGRADFWKGEMVKNSAITISEIITDYAKAIREKAL